MFHEQSTCFIRGPIRIALSHCRAVTFRCQAGLFIERRTKLFLENTFRAGVLLLKSLRIRFALECCY